MVYQKPIPQKKIRLVLKAYLFFPYFILKTYLTLLIRQSGNNDYEKILTDGKTSMYEGIVSVIIPVYNGGNDLKQLIKTLKEQKKVKQIEIIAIDSGSTDGSVEFLKEEEIDLTEIPNSDFSHSGTRNLGVKKASGNILLFMTQDAFPDDSE